MPPKGKLDPAESAQHERMICVETTSLWNKIRYYELAVDPMDRTYRYDGAPIAASPASKDRFCFYAAYAHSHRVGQALSFAMDACGARSRW